MITAHYRASNIVAIGEWANAQVRQWLREDGVLPMPARIRELNELADWCFAWLEHDPGDNGGDPSQRRVMRPEWPQIFADYRRLAEAPAPR